LVSSCFPPFLLSSAVRHWLLPLPLARTETKNPTFLLRAASSLLPPALPALATLRQVSLHFCPRICCATTGLSLINHQSKHCTCLFPFHLGSRLGVPPQPLSAADHPESYCSCCLFLLPSIAGQVHGPVLTSKRRPATNAHCGRPTTTLYPPARLILILSVSSHHSCFGLRL
jgi:hypothetical protein